MRVITGKCRGKKLVTLDGLDTRPTTDMVKEAVFSIIQFDVPGAAVLDLFAGSGQMGVEAAFDTDIPMLADSFMASIDTTVFRYGDEVASGWVTDGYREYLQWIIDLMNEGVIYSDFLALDDDRMVINRLTGAGQIGVWTQNVDKMDELAYFADEANSTFSVTAVPRVVRDTSEPYVWNDEANLLTYGMSLSSTCRDPGLCCRWQNYFYTEDGYILFNYGIEGVTVDYDRETKDFSWLEVYVIGGDVGANAINDQNTQRKKQLLTQVFDLEGIDERINSFLESFH